MGWRDAAGPQGGREVESATVVPSYFSLDLVHTVVYREGSTIVRAKVLSATCKRRSLMLLRERCSVGAAPIRALPVPRQQARARVPPLLCSATDIHADIEKVLYSAEELQTCIDRLGREIGAEYSDKHVLLIGVLKGGYMFCAGEAAAVVG